MTARALRDWFIVLGIVGLVCGGRVPASRAETPDPLDDAEKALESYMLCGLDYVGATAGATVEGAQTICTGLLESYASAVRRAAARAALTNGKSAEDARTYAAKYSEMARVMARDGFINRVQQLLKQGRPRQK
jgi:hypothetical protein